MASGWRQHVWIRSLLATVKSIFLGKSLIFISRQITFSLSHESFLKNLHGVDSGNNTAGEEWMSVAKNVDNWKENL